MDVLSDGLVLVNFRARTYLPQHARFLQRDPTGYSDGNNLYEAFGSNPLSRLDPFGTQSDEPGLFETFVKWITRVQDARHPLTGEDLMTLTLRRGGVDVGLDPLRGAMLAEYDRYEATAAEVAEALEPVVARGVGVAQVAGGVMEGGTGAVLIGGSEGLGAIPGTVFVLHGVDVTQAGARQVWTGEFSPTFTYEVIADAGYPEVALLVDTGISVSSGVTASVKLVNAAGSVRAASSAASGTVRQGQAAPTLFARAERAYDNVLVVLYDAKPGDVVLGSGASPGRIGKPNVGQQLLFPFAESSASRVVQRYEVGVFSGLRARSAPGDFLDLHHVVQRHPAMQLLPQYDPGAAPAIAIPHRMHVRIPKIRGSYTGTGRALLSRDIRALRLRTDAPNSALEELIRLNKELYPSLFAK